MSRFVPKSIIPPGEIGDCKIEKFTISKEGANLFNLRQIISRQGRYVEAGEYSRLYIEGALAMSDTPAELIDHSLFARIAKGNILINGLGLGIVARAVLLKGNVDKVIINEIDKDVISLVGPYIEEEFGDKVQINEADAFLWKPPKGLKFDAVWHDIWFDIRGDNYTEMKLLHRRYARWLNRDSNEWLLPFNSSWCLNETKEANQRWN